MNRLGFWISKLRRDEGRLATLSRPWSELERELDGKTIALLGNARSLSNASFGADIDALDLVIRLNGAPIASGASHGTRTDWIAMSIPIDAATLASRTPQRLLWMTPSRKRLPWRLASQPSFFFYPADMYRELRQELGSRPTTGLMVADLLRRSRAAQINLYGFDFFRSLSLTGRRTAEQVHHDFDKERDWVVALTKRDPRFRLHQVSAAATGDTG
jgi:hypothetical protein